MGRKLPNILVTGTPGTGKSSTCSALIEAIPELKYVDVNGIAKEEDLYSGFDEKRQVHILDEDKICDSLESKLGGDGGCIVDTHTMVDYFPERWFDLVVVLNTNNTVLYDRLAARGYSESKIQENVQAEIMQILEEEAKDSYAENIVQVLDSNTVAELESNVERISTWIKEWSRK